MTGCDLLDYGRVVARGSKKGLPCERLNYLYGELMQENAKLRELCAELMRNAQVAANVGINVGKLAGWERRAGELGVEVDG